MSVKSPKHESMWARHCTTDECQVDPIEGVVMGRIPEWINGVLYRTGFGVQEFEPVQHAFDNFAVIQAVEFKDGRVKYRSRVAECEAYKLSMAKQRLAVLAFGTHATPDPCQSTLGRFMARFKPMDVEDSTLDNPGVNVFFHGDELYGTTESNVITRIDTGDLSTLSEHRKKHSDAVAVNGASAHPHEEEDGSVLNLGNSLVRGHTYYNFIRFPTPTIKDEQYLSAHDQAYVVAKLPARSKWFPSYFHSFGMTERFIVFLEQPFTYNLPKLLTMKLTGYTIADSFSYDPKGITDIHLIDRKTGEIWPILYRTRAFACYHHINAYEEDGHVVVDMYVADGDVYRELYLDAVRNGASKAPLAKPIRVILPLNIPDDAKPNVNLIKLDNTKCEAHKLKTNVIKVTDESLGDCEGEMPRINYSFNGKKYRYFYSCGLMGDYMNFDSLQKHDNVEKKCVAEFKEENLYFCEPVFIAKPGSSEEDDGVVLSFALKEFEPNFMALMVLDGKTFREVGRVIYECKGAVTFTLHGTYKEKMGFK